MGIEIYRSNKKLTRRLLRGLKSNDGYGKLIEAMPKQKSKKTGTIFQAHRKPVLFIFTALVLLGAFVMVPFVRADQFDTQIQALRQQNSQSQQQVGQLQIQADSYQGAINNLQAQIDGLQQAINVNQAKQADLQRQIDDAQAELTKQKKILGENIKAMYVEGDISTLEMLASSKNLSDFVDKQQYRNSVQDKIKTTLDKITALQLQLKQQKETIDGLLKDQQNQQAQLADARSQQASLLAYTQSQQDQYNQQIKQNNSQIVSLRAQQAAANASLFAGANIQLGSACDTSHGDTYPSPWCSAGQDTMLDSWGMFNRECVSYTAWKVAESGRYMPYWGGIGNANQWDDNARAAGIPVDGNPRAGDVAIKNSQPYGHAMYVEGVNSNGTINISQYNASLDGRFSRVFNMSPAGLVFIHF